MTTGASYTERGAAKDVLKVGELETPKPGAGEVLVRVHASGVNPSDVKTRAGNLGPLTVPRTIPQSDGAGVIEAVGAGVPESRVGERVWLYNVNRTSDGMAQGPNGTAVFHSAVDARQAVPLPEGVSFEEGATDILKSSGVVAAYASMSNPTPELNYYPLMFNNTNVRLVFVYGMPQTVKDAAAEATNAFLEAGKLRGRIAATYPLEEIAAAHEHVESGAQIGNVIVKIE